LRRDLINDHLHCFIFVLQHQNCSPDFCFAARETTNSNDWDSDRSGAVGDDESTDNLDAPVLTEDTQYFG